jgi:hypothetical protein
MGAGCARGRCAGRSSPPGAAGRAGQVWPRPDRTVKTYQGSYTVEGGVITQFSVQQVS